MGTGYFDVLKKYTVFRGRATRKEYWMFSLYNFLILFGLAFIEGVAGIAPEREESVLAVVYIWLVFLPSVSVAVRRLHDTGRHGWHLWLGVFPVIGPIILLVFLTQDSHPGSNQYGPNPKATRTSRSTVAA